MERTGLRADAERNRVAVLEAAAEVFAAGGREASLEDVARAAGVGIGTLYRRFPTRDDLIAAVFDSRMTHWAERAQAAADRARTEPWPAFADYVTFCLEQQAADTAFADLLAMPEGASPVFADQFARAFAATTVLVARARAAGVLRRDFDHSDLYLAMLANAGLVKAAGPAGGEASRRLRGYLLAGFRSDATADIPPAPALWRRTAPR